MNSQTHDPRLSLPACQPSWLSCIYRKLYIDKTDNKLPRSVPGNLNHRDQAAIWVVGGLRTQVRLHWERTVEQKPRSIMDNHSRRSESKSKMTTPIVKTRKGNFAARDRDRLDNSTGPKILRPSKFRRSDEEGTSNGTSRFGRDKSEQMNLTSSGDRGAKSRPSNSNYQSKAALEAYEMVMIAKIRTSGPSQTASTLSKAMKNDSRGMRGIIQNAYQTSELDRARTRDRGRRMLSEKFGIQLDTVIRENNQWSVEERVFKNLVNAAQIAKYYQTLPVEITAILYGALNCMSTEVVEDLGGYEKIEDILVRAADSANYRITRNTTELNEMMDAFYQAVKAIPPDAITHGMCVDEIRTDVSVSPSDKWNMLSPESPTARAMDLLYGPKFGKSETRLEIPTATETEKREELSRSIMSQLRLQSLTYRAQETRLYRRALEEKAEKQNLDLQKWESEMETAIRRCGLEPESAERSARTIGDLRKRVFRATMDFARKYYHPLWHQVAQYLLETRSVKRSGSAYWEELIEVAREALPDELDRLSIAGLLKPFSSYKVADNFSPEEEAKRILEATVVEQPGFERSEGDIQDHVVSRIQARSARNRVLKKSPEEDRRLVFSMNIEAYAERIQNQEVHYAEECREKTKTTNRMNGGKLTRAELAKLIEVDNRIGPAGQTGRGGLHFLESITGSRVLEEIGNSSDYSGPFNTLTDSIGDLGSEQEGVSTITPGVYIDRPNWEPIVDAAAEVFTYGTVDYEVRIVDSPIGVVHVKEGNCVVPVQWKCLEDYPGLGGEFHDKETAELSSNATTTTAEEEKEGQERPSKPSTRSVTRIEKEKLLVVDGEDEGGAAAIISADEVGSKTSPVKNNNPSWWTPEDEEKRMSQSESLRRIRWDVVEKKRLALQRHVEHVCGKGHDGRGLRVYMQTTQTTVTPFFATGYGDIPLVPIKLPAVEQGENRSYQGFSFYVPIMSITSPGLNRKSFIPTDSLRNRVQSIPERSNTEFPEALVTEKLKTIIRGETVMQMIQGMKELNELQKRISSVSEMTKLDTPAMIAGVDTILGGLSSLVELESQKPETPQLTSEITSEVEQFKKVHEADHGSDDLKSLNKRLDKELTNCPTRVNEHQVQHQRIFNEKERLVDADILKLMTQTASEREYRTFLTSKGVAGETGRNQLPIDFSQLDDSLMRLIVELTVIDRQFLTYLYMGQDSDVQEIQNLLTLSQTLNTETAGNAMRELRETGPNPRSQVLSTFFGLYDVNAEIINALARLRSEVPVTQWFPQVLQSLDIRCTSSTTPLIYNVNLNQVDDPKKWEYVEKWQRYLDMVEVHLAEHGLDAEEIQNYMDQVAKALGSGEMDYSALWSNGKEEKKVLGLENSGTLSLVNLWTIVGEELAAMSNCKSIPKEAIKRQPDARRMIMNLASRLDESGISMGSGVNTNVPVVPTEIKTRDDLINYHENMMGNGSTPHHTPKSFRPTIMNMVGLVQAVNTYSQKLQSQEVQRKQVQREHRVNRNRPEHGGVRFTTASAKTESSAPEDGRNSQEMTMDYQVNAGSMVNRGSGSNFKKGRLNDSENGQSEERKRKKVAFKPEYETLSRPPSSGLLRSIIDNGGGDLMAKVNLRVARTGRIEEVQNQFYRPILDLLYFAAKIVNGIDVKGGPERMCLRVALKGVCKDQGSDHKSQDHRFDPPMILLTLHEIFASNDTRLTNIFQQFFATVAPCKNCAIMNDKGRQIGGTMNAVPTTDAIVLMMHTSRCFNCSENVYMAGTCQNAAYSNSWQPNEERVARMYQTEFPPGLVNERNSAEPAKVAKLREHVLNIAKDNFVLLEGAIPVPVTSNQIPIVVYKAHTNDTKIMLGQKLPGSDSPKFKIGQETLKLLQGRSGQNSGNRDSDRSRSNWSGGDGGKRGVFHRQVHHVQQTQASGEEGTHDDGCGCDHHFHGIGNHSRESLQSGEESYNVAPPGLERRFSSVNKMQCQPVNEFHSLQKRTDRQSESSPRRFNEMIETVRERFQRGDREVLSQKFNVIMPRQSQRGSNYETMTGQDILNEGWSGSNLYRGDK